MARRRERGATMVLVVVGLAALIAMAGLALDTAHVLLNKSRLQSALDAAALAGAKKLDQSASTTLASADAASVFNLNVLQFPELNKAGLTLTTQFSSTLNPFSAGTTPAAFVRTSITGFTTQMSLISVLGINSINVGGSAVAGPSPSVVQACGVVPVGMCGTSAAGGPLYGYAVGQVTGLNDARVSGAIGPGNFGLLALGGNGAAKVHSNFDNGYQGCRSTGNSVSTEPGKAAGPVSQGIDDRFTSPPDPINSAAHQTSLTTAGNGDIMQGAKDISAITPASNQASALTFNYADYTALLAAQTYDTQPLPTGTAVFGRRILPTPIVNCTGATNGKGSVTVLGFACVFLLQKLGNGPSLIFAQIIGTCDAGGKPGAGSSATGPHIIELHKSAGSPDS
jgi:hypothetical protein